MLKGTHFMSGEEVRAKMTAPGHSYRKLSAPLLLTVAASEGDYFEGDHK
jgi:hypothetical protein